MIEIIDATTPAQITQVRELFTELFNFTRAIEPDLDMSAIPAFGDVEIEMQNLPGKYAPPRGRLKLALSDNQPAGCFALKPIDKSTCELKRLWVRPAFRGEQIGWKLTETLIADARRIGYQRMILDTHRSLTRAQSIYHGLGFESIAPPDDAPAIIKELAVFMALDLR